MMSIEWGLDFMKTSFAKKKKFVVHFQKKKKNEMKIGQIYC